MEKFTNEELMSELISRVVAEYAPTHKRWRGGSAELPDFAQKNLLETMMELLQEETETEVDNILDNEA